MSRWVGDWCLRACDRGVRFLAELKARTPRRRSGPSRHQSPTHLTGALLRWAAPGALRVRELRVRPSSGLVLRGCTALVEQKALGTLTLWAQPARADVAREVTAPASTTRRSREATPAPPRAGTRPPAKSPHPPAGARRRQGTGEVGWWGSAKVRIGVGMYGLRALRETGQPDRSAGGTPPPHRNRPPRRQAAVASA